MLMEKCTLHSHPYIFCLFYCFIVLSRPSSPATSARHSTHSPPVASRTVQPKIQQPQQQPDDQQQTQTSSTQQVCHVNAIPFYVYVCFIGNGQLTIYFNFSHKLNCSHPINHMIQATMISNNQELIIEQIQGQQ